MTRTRKILVSLGLALGLLIGVAGPVDAGWYYWSPSPCRGDVEWYATSYGVWYWLYGWSETHGAKLVESGHFLNTYRDRKYECGWMGAVLTNRICVGSSYSYQDFEGGRIQANWC